VELIVVTGTVDVGQAYCVVCVVFVVVTATVDVEQLYRDLRVVFCG